MQDIIIRRAIYSDLFGLLALYRFLKPDDPEPDRFKAGEIWKNLLESHILTVIVAEIEGKVVSSCVLATIPNLTGGVRPYGLIENVVTHPDYRRRGIGSSVILNALNKAWEANCYKVMLATGSKKPEVMHFYEKAGFQKDSKTFFEVRR